MKKILSFLIILICSFLLVSCEDVSNYQAFMLVQTQKDNELTVSFEKLKGTFIKKINNTNKSDGQIYYEISCESGSYEIYYKSLGEKELLVSINEGEEIKSTGGYVDSLDDVTIYIVAKEGAKGKIKIYLV